MARDLSNETEYYYDSHPTEEDLMGETAWHVSLVGYLKAVLIWLFHEQTCAIHENLNFYQTPDYHEYPVAPDLAVFKGVPFEFVRNWVLGKTGSAPQVIFEILSKETWKKDVREKPAIYAGMGVKEYFAYDPNIPPLRKATSKRLFGWRLDARRGEMVEIAPNTDGWLWSEQLDSWLVPQEVYLRLYDHEHRMRLTGEEAQTQLAEASIERAAEADERAVEAEKRVEEVVRENVEVRRQAHILAEKLRSLGINPDELL